MDRRSFIGGILGAVSSTALVVRASAQDIALFGRKVDEPVGLVNPDQTSNETLWGHDPYLYDRKGNAVAIVQSITVSHENLDTTLFGDSSKFNLPGLSRSELVATLIDPEEWGRHIRIGR